MFWRFELATLWRPTSVTKNACLKKIGAIFKFFFVFPRSFYDCSLSLSTALTHSHRASIFDLHFCFFSAQNPQVTSMGFLSWTLFYLFFFFSLWIIRICLWFWDGFLVRQLLFVLALPVEAIVSVLSFIKLLVLFFLMWLARVCYLLVSHLVWSVVDVLIQNFPVLTVCFSKLIVWF